MGNLIDVHDDSARRLFTTIARVAAKHFGEDAYWSDLLLDLSSILNHKADGREEFYIGFREGGTMYLPHNSKSDIGKMLDHVFYTVSWSVDKWDVTHWKIVPTEVES